MSSKPVSASKTEMAQLMMPNDANFGGFVYGGVIMSIADNVAYVCASRHSGYSCVTVSVDHVVFKEPIRVGELVRFLASVNYVGTTSMEVGIKIIAEDLLTGKNRHTNSCYITMVALDRKGAKKKVPGLILETGDDKRRHEEAGARREIRLEKRI